MSNDLDILAPDTETLTVAGREVVVGELTVDQVIKITKAFKGGKLENLPAGADLLDLIEAFPEEMIQICMIATGATREEMGRAKTDEFLNLCAAIIGRNTDFFVRRLGPSLKRLVGELIKVAAMASAGSTASRP